MVGVNVFGLIGKIQEDMSGTFRAIANAGYDEAELVILLKKKQGKIPIGVATEETIPRLIKEANKHGLQVRSMHVFVGTLFFLTPKKILARCFTNLNHRYGIQTFVFSGLFRDAKGARKWAHALKQLSEMLQTEDIRILYHNHSQEFEMVKIGNKEMSAFDYFFSIAGDLVGLQLDVGWAGVCTDEINIAQKYADRIVSIHLKDFIPGTKGYFNNDNMPKERFCAIGTGEIQIPRFLAMRDSFSSFNGSIIIDQDYSVTDIFEDLRVGYQSVSVYSKECVHGSEKT